MKILIPCFKIDIERWRWNNQYQVWVSNKGRFKDQNKKLMRVRTASTGYLVLEVLGGFKACHRLVLETWQPQKDCSELTVDHLDHNKRNNSVSNLEWVSQEENLFRAQLDMANDEKLLDKQKNLLENLNRSKFEISNGQLKTINLETPIIKCGNNLFFTYDEAINFLINKKKISTDSNRNTIRKGIINSITNKTKYCNLTFELR